MSARTIIIRPLSPADSIAGLTALIRAAYAPLGRQGLRFNGTEQTEAGTAARVQQGLCLVAQAEDALVGTLLVHGPFSNAPSAHLTRSDAAYFQQFAVHPGWQRLGVGSHLLAQAETCAGEAGYAFLTLDTALAADHLLQWYALRGFAAVGQMQWPGRNYRSVVMRKRLAGH